MFYSDRRTSGAGFRLDTTCFQPSVQRQQNEVALGNEVKQHSRRSISICMQLCTTTGFDRLTCMHSYIQTGKEIGRGEGGKERGKRGRERERRGREGGSLEVGL